MLGSGTSTSYSHLDVLLPPQRGLTASNWLTERWCLTRNQVATG